MRAAWDQSTRPRRLLYYRFRKNRKVFLRFLYASCSRIRLRSVRLWVKHVITVWSAEVRVWPAEAFDFDPDAIELFPDDVLYGAVLLFIGDRSIDNTNDVSEKKLKVWAHDSVYDPGHDSNILWARKRVDGRAVIVRAWDLRVGWIALEFGCGGGAATDRSIRGIGLLDGHIFLSGFRLLYVLPERRNA